MIWDRLCLITDLGGFLAGALDDRERLYRWIRQRKSIITLVFTTGRTLEGCLPLLRDEVVPRADFLITDAGASVYDARMLVPFAPVDGRIARDWPGSEKVRRLLARDCPYVEQPSPVRHRLAYDTDGHPPAPGFEQAVLSKGFDFSTSHGRFFDVLPRGVNKGSSALQLSAALGFSFSNTLVCGDSLGDATLFEVGFRGVVLGGAEPELVRRVRNQQDVIVSARFGADGILSALERFGFRRGTNQRTREKRAASA
jgi:hydroxymethylpyrimidine pyrophosphatase-like HAD family hydrolase